MVRTYDVLGIWGQNGKVWQFLEKRTRLKSSSLDVYVAGLKRICEYVTIDSPFELSKLSLEQIEDLTEEWIRGHENELSPKYLNVHACNEYKRKIRENLEKADKVIADGVAKAKVTGKFGAQVVIRPVKRRLSRPSRKQKRLDSF